MGNNACCKDSRSNEIENQRVEIERSVLVQRPIEVREEKLTQGVGVVQEIYPEVSPEVLAILEKKKPFVAEMQAIKNLQKHQINQQTYYGQLDENGLPKGYGKLYKSNGSVYIGQFQQGRAEGEGIFIFSDGSYYEGRMKNNMAESDKGRFQNASIQYIGGFRNNVFHGQGIEKAKNFQFQGEFQNGHRKSGTLTWKQKENGQFSYVGQFDQKGKFTGKGKLEDPLGTYEGNFKDGLKDGFGIYKFKTQIRYQGYYKNDLKNGRGTIINLDNTIAFCGEFVDGLPHGKGYATDKKGRKYGLQWNQGVYADLI